MMTSAGFRLGSSAPSLPAYRPILAGMGPVTRTTRQAGFGVLGEIAVVVLVFIVARLLL